MMAPSLSIGLTLTLPRWQIFSPNGCYQWLEAFWYNAFMYLKVDAINVCLNSVITTAFLKVFCSKFQLTIFIETSKVWLMIIFVITSELVYQPLFHRKTFNRKPGNNVKVQIIYFALMGSKEKMIEY